MPTRSDQMVLIGFLQAQNCSNYPGSWRHPQASAGYMTADHYQSIGRTLEAGKFHLAFFDDRLAMPDILGHDHAEAVRNGVRVVKLDAATVLTMIGAATRHIGLGTTYSATYYEPFHVARVFATLDLMLEGRGAWNVVTSLNTSEAHNFGREEHLEHDLRYDRADEFMEVVLGHWDSWSDDAISGDAASGLFADPAKVRRLDHAGRYFRSRGPFTVPRSAQGRPVVIQAGQSGRGQRFAARWGELVFAAYTSIAAGQRACKAIRAEAEKLGRAPAPRVAPAMYAVVGETQSIAEAKREVIEGLAKPIDALALLSEVLNFDFASKPYDAPFTTEELASIGGLRATVDRVIEISGKPNPTPRDFVEVSKRGTINEFPVFCGTPTRVVDQMQEWFEAGACDGFVLAATHTPGAYEDFVRLVVPELQRRGLFRRDYTGKTLRENLGLPRAEIGDWR